MAMTPQDPSRRQFLNQLAVGAAIATTGLGLAGCDDGVDVQFRHGVASGDPLTDRVILWTRITPGSGGTFNVDWEIASDSSFTRTLNSGIFTTNGDRDYTVKVDAPGLLPDSVYFYRFTCNGSRSAVGQTRTLPGGSVAEVRLAVFSCSNYPAGYFNVFAEAAKRDDLQAALHLGDYIYEYGPGEYASADAESMGRVVDPGHDLVSLDDYRRRYAQYHTDPDLQALHAKVPFICVWDDHEVANNAYKDGAENHDPVTQGSYTVRRANAVQAYHEWVPIRDLDPSNPLLIYRSFDFGDLMSLHMLDTRHVGRDKQLDYANYIDPATGAFDSVSFTADLTDPNRQLMGVDQTLWLQTRLASSGATWQVLGQQIVMGRMNIPSPILTPTPQDPSVSFIDYLTIATAFGTYQAAAAQLTAAGQAVTTDSLLAAGMTADQLAMVNDPTDQAIMRAPSIPYDLDAWDGYFAARETVLGMALSMDKNLVVLSGDSHNAWANDLQDMNGNQVGVEFAGSSVSSPGLEEELPNVDTATLEMGVQELIPTLKYADTSLRGYVVLTVTAAQAQADYYFVDTVKSKNYTANLSKSLKTLPGQGNRKLISA